MKRERIDKVLANLGYGTRKEIKKMCRNGEVEVNGEIVKDSSEHIDPFNDAITVNGERVEYKEFIYLMLNKPQGVITATYDEVERTVIDLIDDEYLVFSPSPVGRLDKDTEGLLLITNDGELNHLLLSPKRHVPKKYYAKVEGRVTLEDVERFKEGVVLDDGYKTMPSELEILASGEISEIELIIYEGKYHQVKRMFEAVGKRVIYLKRIEFGPLKLDENLEAGEYRELSEEELLMLKEAVKKK
ncbi:Ribosomal large subunit pseudouridine synthase B [Caloramator mitchellensis]|uniref:Pseudouridine synthase n=1 Tax=Caloramator mitchellensis TaxID=908809 RepID=A0A0R3K3D0_CALMK|nr:pseudouridine synthase [Caloramator mitchellensis]KRQ87541.1 Ribosomal large subunit pseudouridine synthase B [Caloramator mitchellensis]